MVLVPSLLPLLIGYALSEVNFPLSLQPVQEVEHTLPYKGIDRYNTIPNRPFLPSGDVLNLRKPAVSPSYQIAGSRA